MLRSSAAPRLLLVSALFASFRLPLATAAPKTVMELQHMPGEYVDHQVEEEEAKGVACGLQPEPSGRRPGCEVCSRKDVEYCTGTAVVEDHCCCDMRHFEWFAYVPHTCYLQPGCSPIAGNCARYARLRICCCDHVTAAKWRSEASLPMLPWTIFLLCSMCVLIIR